MNSSCAMCYQWHPDQIHLYEKASKQYAFFTESEYKTSYVSFRSNVASRIRS